ncbi:hypothetical protein JTE90_010641 [Oedothorax gibbosus]|uniref:Uncharacterized protein n=1 Tax=Oedothorax gibbosus TaxID=931172 RepID=A0AAV6UAJ2_9ARAC|nr:hypothetical protein JTE90_010641 [Oedothorax gibbosus]
MQSLKTYVTANKSTNNIQTFCLNCSSKITPTPPIAHPNIPLPPLNPSSKFSPRMALSAQMHFASRGQTDRRIPTHTIRLKKIVRRQGRKRSEETTCLFFSEKKGGTSFLLLVDCFCCVPL